MIRYKQPHENRTGPAGPAQNRNSDTIALALGLLILVGLILLLGHWGYDDPYITFRYARNLLAGHGFVYNVGQRTLSTTAPLYAVLLAGLGLLWPDLPTLSNTLSALAVVVSATCLFGWAKGRGQKAAGMIAALLLSLSPLLLRTFGAETCTYVALILAGLYAYDRSRLGLAAGILALATMVRPDGVIAAAALVLCYLVCRRRYDRGGRRSVPWQPVILYVGLVGLWYAGLWCYFGSPIPVTLSAKQQQGQMAISTRFGPGFLNLVRAYGRQPLYWLHGALAVVGLGRVASKARHWLPLLVWTVLYFLAYILLGVSRYFWYYVPLLPAFVVLVAEGAVALLRLLAQARLPRLVAGSVTGLLVITLLAPLVSGVFAACRQPDPRLEVYRQIGQWLESNTPPQASVGALEVGIIGYYAQRPMIDFAGLIQPDIARQLGPNNTYQEAAAWAIQTYQPDYVALHADAFSALTQSDWFQLFYRPVRDFGQASLRLILYRRSESR